MRNGRPIETPSSDTRNLSEKKIIEGLEESPDTFSDLLDRIDVSKGTLSKGLQKLEEEAAIVRNYEEGDIVISLSEKEASPIETTLRHLNRITERELLDLNEGRNLLTKEVTDACLEIANTSYDNRRKEIISWSESIPDRLEKIERGYSTLGPSTEFTEYILLRALARYQIENGETPHDENGNFFPFANPTNYLSGKFPDPSQVGMGEEEYKKWILEKHPVLKLITENSLLDEFDDLSLWIRPLLMTEKEIERHEEKEVLLWNEIVPNRDNLAYSVFTREWEEHKRILNNYWTDAVEELSVSDFEPRPTKDTPNQSSEKDSKGGEK